MKRRYLADYPVDDLWADEDGSLYVKDGEDFVPVDPFEDLYDESDFRRDVGL